MQVLAKLKPFRLFFIFVLSALSLPVLFQLGFNTLYQQPPFAELNPNVSGLAMLLSYLIAYGITLYYARDYLKVTFIHLFKRVSVFKLLYAIFIGILFTAVILVVMIVFEPPADFQTASDELIGGTNFSRFVLILFTAALGPIIEEFVFRGYIFDGLHKYNSFGTTAVASSLLFAIPHLPNYYIYWPATLVIFSLGMLLAYFRKKNDSLLPCILVHASYNSGLLLLFFASELA